MLEMILQCFVFVKRQITMITGEVTYVKVVLHVLCKLKFTAVLLNKTELEKYTPKLKFFIFLFVLTCVQKRTAVLSVLVP